MKELFLLGAGASEQAGIPIATDMAKEMLNHFSEDYNLRNHYHVLNFVTGGLLFQKGIRGENPYDGINVEDLFNAVQILAEKDNIEIGSFISSWHPLIDKLEGGDISAIKLSQLLDLIDAPIKNALRSSIDGYSGFSNKLMGSSFDRREDEIRELFKEIIHDASTSQASKLLADTNRRMIQKLINIVWIDDAKISRIDHLLPLVEFVKATKATIVTLNYDNTIELTGKTLDIPVDTGISEWSKTGNFTFDSESIPLIKLHGSIDWMSTNGPITEEKPLPYEMITKGIPNSFEDPDFKPELLFGGKNKLTSKGPFLSLLRAFEKALSDSERLTIIGYSFRDDHINEFIGGWINGDHHRTIRVIDPFFSNNNGSFVEKLRSLIANNRLVEISQKASAGILEITRA